MRQLPQPDPRGWLAFTGLPDDLQRAEDATAAADTDRHDRPFDLGIRLERAESAERGMVRCYRRPATPTEKLLLTELGHQVPDDLDTYVHHVTRGTRHRFWPALEQGQTGE